MKRLILVLLLAAGAVQAQAIDPLQVRSWAGACANCHGTNGVAQAGNESLAGVNKDDLLKKMLDFKTGKKPATIMHQLSKGYTDEQLAALAGYFAAQKK
ncbi:MAG: Cytochrome subunit of sulfide dehydrogenase [Pseudomonadota bacterium]|jgi:cytochrome subunit of sulfide dehydrogenase